MTCPLDITQAADQGLDSTTVTWNEPVVADLDDVFTLESNYNSGSSFVIGQYVVVYTATDESGNVGQCSFVIVVEGIVEMNTIYFWSKYLIKVFSVTNFPCINEVGK